MSNPLDQKERREFLKKRERGRTSFISFVLWHLPREKRVLRKIAAGLTVMTGKRHSENAMQSWVRREFACPSPKEWEKWIKVLGLQEREWLKLFIKWLRYTNIFNKSRYVRRPDSPVLAKKRFVLTKKDRNVTYYE